MKKELPEEEPPQPPTKLQNAMPGLILAAVAIGTVGVAVLLVTIIQHKQEAEDPYVRLVDVDEASTDPVPWGTNWPFQFDSYRQSVDLTETEFGGSSAMPPSKLEMHPWLKRLYDGYAFSIDYREARGHAYMLHDQEVTERVTKRSQSGACLHCHASVVPTYRRIGMLAMGEDPTPEALGADFNWPAVMKGFELTSDKPYAEVHAELLKTPDGTPGKTTHLFPGGVGGALKESGGEAVPEDDIHSMGDAHPVSCVDCHAPDDMRVRVTRPGFMLGVAALAESNDPVPHLPSIEKWRQGPRSRAYDPNIDASRQEMRSFTCAQCHVEYYCASKETLFFPWANGLKVEQIEAHYDERKFSDGEEFHDWVHAETGAKVYKAQHPEFELWSQGVHARSGVSCADCHMPYERQGATKVSSHWVRSPMLNINKSCQTCHNVPESELRDKVATIQYRTNRMIDRAAVAMTDMLDAIKEVQAAGAPAEDIADLLDLQKKAMWRLDFISSENSKGFHASQEAARILAESIDYSRQAQAKANRMLPPKPKEEPNEAEPDTDSSPDDQPVGQ